MEVKEGTKPRFQLDAINGADARLRFARLLDQAFHVPPGHTFLEDFPVWDETIFPAGDRLARIGAFLDGGTLVACAGVRMAKLAGQNAEILVALIGAVATDKNYRGFGLASNLVSFATEWARSRGAAAVFLWGSEHSLYQRLGFELCGAQTLLPLAQTDLKPNREQRLNFGWTSGILPLMQRRPGGLRLEAQDERWLAAHRNVQWFWTGESRAPQAYAAMGRGIDLEGTLHEWGGEPQNLRRLLGSLKELYPGAALLGAPGTLEALGISCQAVKREYLCMAKILDPSRLIRGFHPEAVFSASADGDGFQVILGDQGRMPVSSREMARLIFGSTGSEPLTTSGRPRLSYLPLPLWIWGLDAV